MSRLFTRQVRSWTVSARAPQTRNARNGRRGIRLRLQDLEDRSVPAITVLNADPSGPGSFSDAINQADANAGADVINFDPVFFATPQTINLPTTQSISNGDLLITNSTGAANVILTHDSTGFFGL